MTSPNIPASAAYLLCFISVAIYAQRRLNTPPSNRSSTRIRLYRQAVLGYVACTLILFIILSSALQYQAMDRLLLGFGLAGKPYLNSIAALPAPLIATVLLTIWLPNVPLIRDVDEWVLNAFKARANIPSEGLDRANRLTPQFFSVSLADLPRLTTLIQDEGLPDELTNHLNPVRGDGLELSRYRFTRVLKLYGETKKLDRDQQCERFFADYDDQWTLAKQEFRKFCDEAAAGLERARKLQEQVSPAEYEALVAEKREKFRELSASIFSSLALFAAGAVLAKQDTEHGIGSEFRAIGFTLEDEPERPEFPLRSLAGLALLLLLYLVVTDLVLHGLHLIPDHPELRFPVADSARPFFVLASYAVTIGTTVWLIEQDPRLQRTGRSGGLRWDVYALCAVIGAGIVAVMWLGLFLLRYGELPNTEIEWNRLVAICTLVGSLCAAIACCCDIRGGGDPETILRQLAEGTACAVVLAAITEILLRKLNFGPYTADESRSISTAITFVLFPASIAFIVGSLVPHICRAERRLACWRSDQIAAARPTADGHLQIRPPPAPAE